MRTILTIVLAAITAYGSAQTNDVKRVLCIGNSFTFFSDSPQKLVDIAKSEGHTIEMNAIYVGGYTFNRHLNDLKTISAIESGRYDYAFLQDQSQMHARYANDTVRFALAKRDTKELAERIRMYSANVNIMLECTWSYTQGDCGGFGTLENFDNLLQKGADLLANDIEAEVSPIGKAFSIARKNRPDIDLYDPDQKHQSAYGTYLKSCVNYLLIYHQPFGRNTDSCGLDEEKCSYLRKVAEEVVKP